MPFSWVDSVRGRFFPIVNFVPDTGDGGGGAGEGGDPPEPGEPGEEQKFTKADIEAAVKKRLKKKEQEQKELKDQLAASQAEKADLEAKIAAIGDGSLDAEAKKRLGTLEVEKKRYEGEIAGLTASQKALADRLDAETNRRMNMERDALVESALLKVGCVDPKTAKLIFQSRCSYDEESETWLFEMESGNTVTIETGIAAELPDYMRTASSRGGAGTSGGTMKPNRGVKHLEELERKYEAAKRAVAHNTNNVRAMTDMSRLKKEIDGLKKAAKV